MVKLLAFKHAKDSLVPFIIIMISIRMRYDFRRPAIEYIQLTNVLRQIAPFSLVYFAVLSEVEWHK